VVVLLDVDFFLNVFDSLNCDIASLLESISNLEWMNALIEELLSLLKESTSEDYDSSSSITDFVILRLRELDQ
jgi:hypothetical protein